MVGSGSDDVRVLFVVGARRSGTNWVQRLLCMHPDLIPVPAETYLFHSLAELAQRFHHGLVGSANTGATYLPREEMIAVFRDLANRTFRVQLGDAGEGKTLVERTPWHASNLDLIAEVYPQAPLVHLIRDGREVAASLVRQSWGPISIEEAAEEWRDTVTTARACTSPHYVEVRHEALSHDLVATMRGLFQSLGLDPTDDVMKRIAATGERLVNTGRDERRIASGRWRSELTTEQLETVEAVAGSLLEELGYDLSSAATEPAPSPQTRRLPTALRTRLASRRPRRGDPDVAAFPQGDVAQFVSDRFMEALADRDPAKLAQVFAANIEVTFPVARETITGDDPLEVAKRVIERLDVRGTQVRGDGYGALETFTMFTSHDDAGTLTHRVFVAVVTAEWTISALTAYEVHGEVK